MKQRPMWKWQVAIAFTSMAIAYAHHDWVPFFIIGALGCHLLTVKVLDLFHYAVE